MVITLSKQGFQLSYAQFGRLSMFRRDVWCGGRLSMLAVSPSPTHRANSTGFPWANNPLTPTRLASTSPPDKRTSNDSRLRYIPSESANLYENTSTRPNLFSMVSAISGVQLLFWIYLAYFAFTELKQVESKVKLDNEEQEVVEGTLGNAEEVFSSLKDSSQTADMNNRKFDSIQEQVTSEEKQVKKSLAATVLTSSKLRILVSLLSLSTGLFFAFSACMYPLRVVHKLTYIRPTQAVQVVTYTPLGSTRTLTVPLQDVTCSGSRFDGRRRGHFGLKIKGYSLYFLLDQQAMDASPNVRMFDSIIGIRRKLY